jgi:arylsulfatase A-like enzyme
VVIWGDDTGMTNLSCDSFGLMGCRTPNIDRIAREGMMFTDWYGEQSGTAGRSAFITGQSVFRAGLSKVGVPAAPIWLRIAELRAPAPLPSSRGSRRWPRPRPATSTSRYIVCGTSNAGCRPGL